MAVFLRWTIRGLMLALAVPGTLAVLATSTAHAGGACRGAPVTEASGAVVHFAGVCISPTILHVNAGGTVTWMNDIDTAAHTVTGANAAWGSFDEVAPGGSMSHQFATAGVYPYYCFIHPGMVGAVVVGASAPAQASVSIAGGAAADAAVNATTTSGNDVNHVRLYVVIVVAVGIVAATGGFVLGGRSARS